MDADVVQQWGQDRSLGNTILESALSGLLSVAGLEHKAAVWDQLHNEAVWDQLHNKLHNISIWQHPEEFHGAVSYAAVRLTRTAPAVPLALKQSSKSCVSRVTWSTVNRPLRKPASSWGSWGSIMVLIYTFVDHPFKQLEWDAQQWDGPVALRVVLGLVTLWEGDDSCLTPDFWDFTSFQTGRHILTQPLGYSVPCMQKELWVDIVWSWGFACLHRFKCFHQFLCGKWD